MLLPSACILHDKVDVADGWLSNADDTSRATAQDAGKMPPVQHCLTRKVNQFLVSLRHHGLKETHTVAADALLAGAAIVAGQQSGPAGNDMLDEEMSPLKRATSARAGRNQTAMNGPAPITDGIVQFDGEREMWASFQDANLRKRRRLKVLVGGAALLVSLCMVFCSAWLSSRSLDAPLHGQPGVATLYVMV